MNFTKRGIISIILSGQCYAILEEKVFKVVNLFKTDILVTVLDFNYQG